ncbi:sulfotransferase domain-containing protein [Psychroserpens algicola]|uniref:sulfotransferase domain-containing protein n=1 Tax=Psychroserpens algicola TaxID=1719034 RepID=UPI0019537879|nr:sulfotransferase domain-containing protein [Psychroserpens algicola]
MPKFNKHIIIVGTARSGTSWLSETMASQHRYRMLFEPEHETQTLKGHLLCDKWITSQTVSKDVHSYLTQIFSNRVDSDWIAQNSNRKFKRHLWPFIPKKFIIKFVRANLMAQYMNESYGIPVIHLLRNPYDVIRSQQKVKFPWLYDLSHFVKQEALLKLIKHHFGFDISTYETLSDIEILALRWCIENVLPLDIFESYTSHVKVVTYETLVSDIKEFYNLCDEFQIEPVSNLEDYYKKPSSKTHPESRVHSGKKEVSNWSQDDLNKMNTILDTFKTTLYPRQY